MLTWEAVVTLPKPREASRASAAAAMEMRLHAIIAISQRYGARERRRREAGETRIIRAELRGEYRRHDYNMQSPQHTPQLIASVRQKIGSAACYEVCYTSGLHSIVSETTALTPKQGLYRGGRPNRVASFLNRSWAAIHALGIAPNYLVTLEVTGRCSGRTISLPLVLTIVDGKRYLVSMLGAEAGWVRNVQAADGHAVLRHGWREVVHLEVVLVEQRAPILKAYLQRAPGARGHVSIDKDAPLSEFERVVAQYPVFLVVAEG
jgi:hypothetical protein